MEYASIFNSPFVIPLFMLAVGGIIAVVAMILYYLRSHHLHKERLIAMEKGVDLSLLYKEPEENGRKPKTARTYLLRGAVWLAIGVGFIVFFLGIAVSVPGEDFPWGVSMLGIIPAFIGVAYLIFYAIEGGKMREEEEQRRLEKERKSS